MNVFLDTTLTYQDPFFKTVTNKILIKLVEELGGTMYISSVVLQETKEHLRKNMVERIKNVINGIDDYNKLTNTKLKVGINENIESYIKELEKFYQQLEDDGVLEIVEYDNNILPIIVDRAIKRKKPFSENKDEFRDTIIWLSYTNIINKNELDNCYFVTNNTSDFYADDKKSLHPDLLKDCANVKLVKSSKEIIDSSDEHIKSIRPDIETRVKLLEWISANPITDDYLTDLLSAECEDTIRNYLESFFNKGNTPGNMDYFADCLELDTFDISFIDSISYELIDDGIYISGMMTLDVYADAMLYNSCRDFEDDMYSTYDNMSLIIKLEFSLIHKGYNGIEDLEINGVWKFMEIKKEDLDQ